VRVYYAGPYASFGMPKDPNHGSKEPEYWQFTRISNRSQEEKERKSHDVPQDVAADLLSRTGHNFNTVDPADKAKVFDESTPRGRRRLRAAQQSPQNDPSLVTDADLPEGLTVNSPAAPTPKAAKA
jgi:hypothetical protein